jgi:hypothetical protein
LRVLSGKTLKLELPAATYEKLPVKLFDTGRRELLTFTLPTERLAAILAEPELQIKAGNARVRLRHRDLAALREALGVAITKAGAR